MEKSKYDYILEQAQIIAKNVQSWTDFSAKIFDQHCGLIAKNLTDLEQKAFLDSLQYQKLNQILLDIMKKFGVNPKVVDKSFVGERYVREISHYVNGESADEGFMRKVEEKFNLPEQMADDWRRKVLCEIAVDTINDQPINYSEILLNLIIGKI